MLRYISMQLQHWSPRHFCCFCLWLEVAMGVVNAFLACVFFIFALSSNVVESSREDDDSRSEFILDEPVEVVRTEAGEVRALMGTHDENHPLRKHNVALGFITMQPKSLFLPHYMDSSIVFVIQQGDAMVKWIQGRKVITKDLKTGDLYVIPAGVVFYVLNTGEEQQLKMLGIMDTSSALRKGEAQPFFIGGGLDPKTVLSGFDAYVLAAAFKVSPEDIEKFLSSQAGGPIVRTTVELFEGFTNKQDKKGKEHKKDGKKGHKKDGKKGKEHKKDGKKDKKHQDDDEDDDKKHKEAFNLLKRRSFENQHGWIASTAEEEDVKELDGTRIEVFAAQLNTSCMLAPHWNSRGYDFGIVTKGSGTIQIAFANGTSAADEVVDVGSVFYVPQFLPVCQIASSDGPLEFVGFTVSSDDGLQSENNVQFVAGNESVLKRLDLGILALSFGVPEQLLESFLDAQEDSVILPGPNSSSSEVFVQSS